MNFGNQVVSIFRNKRQKRHIKQIDLNLTQSSVLRPRGFEQVCTELLREGHRIKFRAPGNSMYPTILDRDLLTVEPIKPLNVSTGDIILYRHKNGIVVHRVVKLEIPQSSALSPQHFFTFLGDAAINNDDPVRADQILGKVVSIERNGRRFDPYCLRVKLQFKARRLASRIKRLLISSNLRSI